MVRRVSLDWPQLTPARARIMLSRDLARLARSFRWGEKVRLGSRVTPRIFGLRQGGKRLTPQGDARVQPELVGVSGEKGHMRLRQRDGEPSLLSPDGDICGVVREAPGSLRHRWGGGCCCKIIGIGGMEICGVGMV